MKLSTQGSVIDYSSTTGFMDGVADIGDVVEVEVMTSSSSKFEEVLYIHVNGRTIFRMGGIKKLAVKTNNRKKTE